MAASRDGRRKLGQLFGVCGFCHYFGFEFFCLFDMACVCLEVLMYE